MITLTSLLQSASDNVSKDENGLYPGTGLPHPAPPLPAPGPTSPRPQQALGPYDWGGDATGVAHTDPPDEMHAALAHALATVGDRWTLLVVAALLDGPRRFGELREQVEESRRTCSRSGCANCSATHS